MKRARPPLASRDLQRADALLTTTDVARLLRVHPKHVYRLLRRGLPGQRVGGEWRFRAAEVLGWTEAGDRGAASIATTQSAATLPDESSRPLPVDPGPPPLIAANGDLAVEHLLSCLTAGGAPLFGLVPADRGQGLELLRRGEVLAAGCHGHEIPGELDGRRLAFIHLVDRDVGLALRPGVALRGLASLGRWRLASRPPTAGVRAHLDEELRKQGVDPVVAHARAAVLPSHREVVCAVARREADVGLASLAWSQRVGLAYVPLCREAYGLLVPASLLGDPRVVRLCAVAQGAAFRRVVGAERGYQTRRTGAISHEPPRPPQQPK